MTDIGKFLSDIQRIKKHDRQNHSGNPDYNRIFRDLNSLFLRSTSCPADLARSVFEYWENEYIFNSQNQKEEPSEENSQKLAAMLAFLEDSDEFQSVLTQKDWQELRDLVNYEAEGLPVDILQSLMRVLVEKGAY
ncbi:MAG: hypothetical protein SPH83_06490 [Treponema sp.]|nr:hypothetical protein [Spirochaetales bacterium]MDY6190127.1 hypothetical protein [Treponema sp.]